MLDIKIIIIYLFISSVLYRFFLFPKKILSLRGLQLILLLLYYFSFVFNFLKLTDITFVSVFVLHFIFIIFPQIQAKKILDMIILSDGKNEEEIEKKLKILFLITMDFKAFKHENGLSEYFLTTLEKNNVENKVSKLHTHNFIKRYSIHTTNILSIIIVLFYILTKNQDPVIFQANLIKYGGNFHDLVEQGEYFRLLTSVFLHANLIHLLMNLFALFYLGGFVERIAIKRSFMFSVFITGGIFASFCSFYFAKQNSVGASGAVFALIGALTVIVWLSKDEMDEILRKRLLKDMIFIIFINIMLGLSVKNIDNYAHMGGLIFGLLITFVLYKFKKDVLFSVFNLISITLTVYFGINFYTALKNSYPEKITYTNKIKLSDIDFKIPSSWKKTKNKKLVFFEDTYFSRFIFEKISKTAYDSADFLNKSILSVEFNGKEIKDFEKIDFKINEHKIKLIKFSVVFAKNDIRIMRIYFFKYRNKYFRIFASFFKSSFERYGDIVVRILEENLSN